MNKKKVVLGSGILVVLILAMALIWTNFREKPVEGSKEITIEVVNSKEESVIYELKTDAKFLNQAMEEAREDGLTFKEDNSRMVIEVNGEQAVYVEDNAYWGFYVNEEYCEFGIYEQPIENGDAFKIVYTKAD